MTMQETTRNDDVTLESQPTSRWREAFVCGAVAGFSLGILFAPFRGADTRRRLAASTRSGYSRASGWYNSASRSASRNRARVTRLVNRTRTRPHSISDTPAS